MASTPGNAINITTDGVVYFEGLDFTPVTITAGTAPNDCGSTVKFTVAVPNITLSVTDANGNIVIGADSGGAMSGSGNTVLGASAVTPSTGSSNIIIGLFSGSGYSTTESSNILLNNQGVALDSHTLRAGSGTGTGTQQLSKAFISGINGNTVSDTKMVTINSTTDQLGVETFSTGGNFTPVLAFGGDSTGIAYATQSGSYSQVGDMVFCTIKIFLTSKGSATGVASISGFPVSSSNLNNTLGIASYNNITLTAGYTSLDLFLSSPGTTFTFEQSGSGVSTGSITDAAFSNTSGFILSGFYFIS